MGNVLAEAKDTDNLDEFIGRIEASLNAHVEAQLKGVDAKLDKLIGDVAVILLFIASLDELKEQLGPVMSQLENSPLFKMLGKMG